MTTSATTGRALTAGPVSPVITSPASVTVPGTSVDLSTTYLGLSLRSCLVASSSPITATVDGVRALADAGIGAVVLPSIFEEEVREQEVADLLATVPEDDAHGEADGYFPTPPRARTRPGARGRVAPEGGTAAYLRHLERVVHAVDVPVIASLNGSTPGGWTAIASAMESSGAAAVEVNLYGAPRDPGTSSADVESRQLEVLAGVRSAVSVPVAVKLSPYLSSVGATAQALAAAGADGLVLFNRFIQPDIDVETMSVVPSSWLSTPEEGRLPRTWIALLRGRVGCSLAATTGVETSADVVAHLLAGADVVMTASAVLRHGPRYAGELREGLVEWLRRKGYRSVAEARGLLAVGSDVDVAAHERAGYVRALRSARAAYGAAPGRH
ncbi:MAG TPA: dihydroorotate dehydrogenase-like protein [Dermatophilaceae bacterium]|nr:dihydroorotate dehydrogenase-like protein [Dermatophilaceae bacterium]